MRSNRAIDDDRLRAKYRVVLGECELPRVRVPESHPEPKSGSKSAESHYGTDTKAEPNPRESRATNGEAIEKLRHSFRQLSLLEILFPKRLEERRKSKALSRFNDKNRDGGPKGRERRTSGNTCTHKEKLQRVYGRKRRCLKSDEEKIKLRFKWLRRREKQSRQTANISNRKQEGRNQSGKQPARRAKTGFLEGRKEAREPTQERRKKRRKKPTGTGKKFSVKGRGRDSRRAKKGNKEEVLEEEGDPQRSQQSAKTKNDRGTADSAGRATRNYESPHRTKTP